MNHVDLLYCVYRISIVLSGNCTCCNWGAQIETCETKGAKNVAYRRIHVRDLCMYLCELYAMNVCKTTKLLSVQK